MPDTLVKLSILQARVYFVVKRWGPLGPTKIGHRLNFDYDRASPNVTRPLKYLLRVGLIRQHRINGRVVTYAAANDIDPPFEIIGGTHEELQYADQ